MVKGVVHRVIVCGMKGIGKTTLLEQLLYSHRPQDIHPTIEDIYVASVETEKGAKEILRLYDTEGISAIPSDTSDLCFLPKQYYSIADAFVLIYAVDSRQSFSIVDSLKKDIDRNRDKREVPIVVLGIGCKSEDKREVDPSFATGWATREKFRHFEVSISDRRTLLQPFTYLASKFSQSPPKSSFQQLGGIVSRKPKEPVT